MLLHVSSSMPVHFGGCAQTRGPCCDVLQQQLMQCHAGVQVKAVRVEGSQLTQQGDVLVILEPSEE